MRRDRRVLGVVAVAVVAVGATARFGLSGTVADAMGGVLYAGLVFVLLAVLMPAARTAVLGAVATLWCVGVECWQLSGTPAALGREFPPLRLVLGSGFSTLDLVTAVAGVLAAVAIDLRTRHSRVGNDVARRS